MVTSVSSFGRSGVSDWLIQRVSAVILLLYFIWLTAAILMSGDMSYTEWRALFMPLWVKIFSLLALLSLCAHAWIGMWTIGTDYLTNRMLGRFGTMLRLLYQLGCAALIFVYFIWCVQILWGIQVD